MKRYFGRIGKRRAVSLIGLVILCVGLLMRFLFPQEGVADVTGRAEIIDGDSLVVSGREVRMQGIDAPEGRQTCRRDGREWNCGDAARRELRQMISGQSVFCKGLDVDKHGRLLALCKAGATDLNREMVLRGFAMSYGRYGGEEAEARRSKSGLWASEFEHPRQWRRDRNIGL